MALVLGDAAQEVRAATQAVQGAVPSPAPGSNPAAAPGPRPTATGSAIRLPRAPRPRTRIEISEIEAQQQFADALRSAGLQLSGLPVMDGQRHYAPVEGNRGKQKSGAYMGFYDGGVPNGIVWNYKAGTRLTWKATGEAVPLSPEEHRRLAEQAAAARAADTWRRSERARTPPPSARRGCWRAPARRRRPMPICAARASPRCRPGLREDLRGNLIIPLRDTAGSLRNMQTILARPPKGGTDKLYQEGAQKTGTGFLLGTLRPGAARHRRGLRHRLERSTRPRACRWWSRSTPAT